MLYEINDNIRKKKLVKEELRHTPALEYRECFMSHGRKCRRYFLGFRNNKSFNISPVLKYHLVMTA